MLPIYETLLEQFSPFPLKECQTHENCLKSKATPNINTRQRDLNPLRLKLLDDNDTLTKYNLLIAYLGNRGRNLRRHQRGFGDFVYCASNTGSRCSFPFTFKLRTRTYL